MNVIQKYKCTPLMSEVVRSGLDHRQDKNNPQVKQVGDFDLPFSYIK